MGVFGESWAKIMGLKCRFCLYNHDFWRPLFRFLTIFAMSNTRNPSEITQNLKPMKKLILGMLFIFVFTSCATAPLAINKFEAVDYSRYFSKGFFLTEATSVNFDYTPIASVSVKMYDGMISYTNFWATPNANDGLEILVEKTKSLNANGIINLRIEPFESIVEGHKRFGIIITGMAISK